jgi:hypothetical protein
MKFETEQPRLSNLQGGHGRPARLPMKEQAKMPLDRFIRFPLENTGKLPVPPLKATDLLLFSDH